MILNVSFEDFRRLCDEYSKRIYYYLSDNSVFLYFITDGIFISSVIKLDEIENKETFFGDRMFTGAIRLLFKLPNNSEQSISLQDGLPKLFSNIVEDEKTVEGENEDIQKEGVMD
jgi:hypothetical protein